MPQSPGSTKPNRIQRLEAKLIIMDVKLARLTEGRQQVAQQLEKLRTESKA